ncbi:uncharacterized protein METZ01_LOCUS163756, partial [marine metagenome]
IEYNYFLFYLVQLWVLEIGCQGISPAAVSACLIWHLRIRNTVNGKVAGILIG